MGMRYDRKVRHVCSSVLFRRLPKERSTVDWNGPSVVDCLEMYVEVSRRRFNGRFASPLCGGSYPRLGNLSSYEVRLSARLGKPRYTSLGIVQPPVQCLACRLVNHG